MIVATGRLSTVRSTDGEGFPVVVCVVVTPLVTFGFTPTVLDVTSIVTVQLPLARLGTVKFKAVAPTTNAGAFVTPMHVPPIVVDATLMFVRASVKFAFVSVDVFGFVSVNVIVEVPPEGIVAGLNAFAIVGGTTTSKLALEVRPVSAIGPVAVGAVVVFVIAPDVLLVTFNCTWQLLLAAIEAALKRTLSSPAADAAPLVVVTVPQAAGVNVKVVSSSVNPVGKVSSTCTAVNAVVVFGFARVNVSVVLPVT